MVIGPLTGLLLIIILVSIGSSLQRWKSSGSKQNYFTYMVDPKNNERL